MNEDEDGVSAEIVALLGAALILRVRRHLNDGFDKL